MEVFTERDHIESVVDKFYPNRLCKRRASSAPSTMTGTSLKKKEAKAKKSKKVKISHEVSVKVI